MPSLKSIRKRISSVKNTQKITRAMKLVAAARLRRAQDAIVAARPYAQAMERIIAELSARSEETAHPLLETRELKRVRLLLLTSDRGLAGAFNANVTRQTDRFLFEHKDRYEMGLGIVGRKGCEYYKRRKGNIVAEWPAATSADAADRAAELCRGVIDEFMGKELDGVFLVYNEFKSAISQNVKVEQLLPVVPHELPEGATPTDYIYEPSKKEVLDHILPRYVEVEIYRALLESVASELGARMSAMDNATNNASEMIDKLTLQYNRARQAAITKELLEIISGAEALKG